MVTAGLETRAREAPIIEARERVSSAVAIQVRFASSQMEILHVSQGSRTPRRRRLVTRHHHQDVPGAMVESKIGIADFEVGNVGAGGIGICTLYFTL